MIVQPMISAAVKHMPISVSAFFTLSEPWTEFASIDFSEFAAYGAGVCLGRISRTHDFAIGRDGVLALKHLQNNRTRGHEVHEIGVKWSIAMNRIENFSVAARPLHPFLSDDPKTCRFDQSVDLSGNITPCGIRLDD